MSDKFLHTGGSGNANISNGTVDVFAATLSAANLDPSRPIKTNSVRVLVSSNLDIADVNNLQTDLTQKSELNFINGGGVPLPPSGQVSLYSKTDNNLYYITSTGNETLIGTGTSSQVGQTEYKFNSSTAGGDPGTGRLTFDTADPVNASVMRCSYDSQSGTDISNFLNAVAIDDEVYVQAKNDADRWYIFKITSSTDQLSYYDFGAVFIRSSAVPSLSNNEILTFVIQREEAVNEPEVFSTGIYNGGKITQSGSSTFDISAGSGYIMSSTNEYIEVVWSSILNTPMPAGQNDVYVAIDKNAQVYTQNTPFSNEDTRNYIILGNIFSATPPNISSIGDGVVYVNHPVNQIRDLGEALGLFNIVGNIYSANAAGNLTIDKTSGKMYKHGSNFHINNADPNTLTLGALVQPNLFFGTQNAITASGSNVIDPNQWDDGGVLETVPVNDFSIQRIYNSIANNTVVYYGQTTYDNKQDALNAVNSDPFTSTNDFAGLLLRGFLVVKRGTTDLTDTDDAVFLQANRSGDQASGTTPASATQTFQQVYDNSNPASFTTNATNGALTIQEGTGTATNKIIEIKDNVGTTTLFSIDGKGDMKLGTGLDNIVIGNQPITQSGFENTCVGGGNMTSGTASGNANVCIGFRSGELLTTGGTNVLVGHNAGASITSGGNNTCVGYFAGGNNISAGSDNTLIGDEAGASFNGVNNAVALGKGSGVGTGHDFSSCLGANTRVDGTYGIALGYGAIAPANTFKIGSAITAQSITSVLAGEDGVCDLGDATHRFKDIYSGGALLMYDNTGTVYGGFRAPSIMFQNTVWSLPSGDGTNGQVLFTDGNNNLGWVDLPVISSPIYGTFQRLGTGFSGTSVNLASTPYNILTNSNNNVFNQGVSQAQNAEYVSTAGLEIDTDGVYKVSYYCNINFTFTPAADIRFRIRYNKFQVGNTTLCEQTIPVNGTLTTVSFAPTVFSFVSTEDIWVDITATNAGIVNIGSYSLTVEKI